ncbi:hypothetical protein [Haloarcula litorea]|uniref:hypothetical protein n=1 Tax=Haloarcula litorea TaxID=3032579 RepID=UPI0023E7DDB8|nr:hypothetical protein [Halomicroarcula sp. GDY20]
MSSLAAVLRVGERPTVGLGLRPRVEAHLYTGGVPRLVAFRVTDGPELTRVPGAYAPDFGAEPPSPVTDLLLAVPELREPSAVAQRLDTLSTKAEANYGRDFAGMVFTSDVEWGSDGYGRLFEARSQLEAHEYAGVVTATLTPAAAGEQASAIRTNLDRLDAATRVYTPERD